VRLSSVAAGAERQCAPAARIGRFWAALNFTVRWQRVTPREIQERAFA
jgi:hypothetical protein